MVWLSLYPYRCVPPRALWAVMVVASRVRSARLRAGLRSSAIGRARACDDRRPYPCNLVICSRSCMDPWVRRARVGR